MGVVQILGGGESVCVWGAAAARVSRKRFERSVECKKRAGKVRRSSYQWLPLTDGRCPHLKMDNVKTSALQGLGDLVMESALCGIWCLVGALKC